VTQGRRAWNAWDAPYFAAPGERAGPKRAASLDVVASSLAILPLADGGARIADRILAILLGFGAVLGGAALTGILLLARLVLSFGSEPEGGEVLVASLIGGAVAIGGVALAVLTYRHAGRPQQVSLDRGGLEIEYRTFKDRLVVPRELVRVVAIDDAPPLLFTDNRRFPIDGALPAHVFADALDNYPAPPWEDLDPERRSPFPSPAAIDEGISRPAAAPGEYRHDDPVRDGWASAGRHSPAITAPREAHLWSAAGSSLPFLRVGPGDVPNLAVLFSEPLRTPRAPWWFELSPIYSRRILFRGGRVVRGVLLRVRDPSAAASAFSGWGVLRGITAEDVVSEGLLVARPLAGLRALAYGAVVVGSMVIDLVLRAMR
jgi:hypothetical protein